MSSASRRASASASRPKAAKTCSSKSAFEGGKGQTVALELRVVELGELLVARPYDRLALGVDRVRERHALRVVDAGNRLRERERDALERVVIVVQDDHPPRAAGAGAAAGARAFLRGCERRAHSGASVAITASAITFNGRCATWLALRSRSNASLSDRPSFSISSPLARSIALRAASASASESTSSRTAASSACRARAVSIAGTRSCSRNGLTR